MFRFVFLLFIFLVAVPAVASADMPPPKVGDLAIVDTADVEMFEVAVPEVVRMDGEVQEAIDLKNTDVFEARAAERTKMNKFYEYNKNKYETCRKWSWYGAVHQFIMGSYS